MKGFLTGLLVLGVVGLVTILSMNFPMIHDFMGGAKFCGMCHSMDPVVASYNRSFHKEYTSCGDCHVPHNKISGPFYKSFVGIRDVIYTISGHIRKDFAISSHGAKVVNTNCYRCHKDVMHEVNFPNRKGGQDCFFCHRNIPHGRFRYTEGGNL